ncbi:hypothetical protein C8Q79DRAFT_446036 [Trametes meyenii]|nr:hypothetical protein C8Q79DRAFT_446036 [Trametes meyenii]
MSPRDNTTKPEVVDIDFGDADVYARAWSAMAKLQGQDLGKVPYVTIESTLGLVSTALGVLATYWPVLETVRAAVDLTKTVIVTKENIRKRIAGLRLMQADMLCCLFSLRDFKREDMVIDDQMLPGKLEVLCGHIKNDIKRLGNVMENYVNENWLGRILKDKGWKEAVTKCSRIVEDRKKDILQVMALYTAQRADQIASSVKLLAPGIANIAIKVEALQALFLPAPDEAEAKEKIEELGGPDACMQSETKLNDLAKLIPKDEESGRRGAKSVEGRGKLTPAELRRIRTPVEELLEKNLARFESKIDFLVDKAKREHNTIKSVIRRFAGARPYVRIENPDIKKLWKEMGWGGSIDAHSFVLNLYDYFIDLERESHVRPGTLLPVSHPESLSSVSPIVKLEIPRSSSPAPSEAGTEEHDEFEGCTTPAAAAEDAWCLNYFNYRTLSTFMEVLDDDMNGLIKIKEVNEFTSGIPEGVTLMQWIVYCAYGWLVATHIYRLRIESIIEGILGVSYAKPNTAAVATYTTSLQWIVACLRSLGEPDLEHQQLLKLTHVVMEKQEQAARAVLEMFNYELEEEDIRTMMDLTVRGGPRAVGRIEGRILPVIFLVLQQHYRLISLTDRYVLDESVLERAAHTLDCITDLMFNRAAHLMEQFTKLQYDVPKKIQYLANGMFADVHRHLVATDNKARLDITNEWCLQWRAGYWLGLSWQLREYDPDFELDPNPGTMYDASLKSSLCAIRAASNADEGYEEVADWRKSYGVRLVSSLTEQELSAVHDNASDNDQAVSHYGIQCDGCLTYPVRGARFKCIDCPDFDYCAVCYTAPSPPLMHPNAIAGQHGPSHRFLWLPCDIPSNIVHTIIYHLRTTPVWNAHPETGTLDPLVEHCLSADAEAVQQTARALAEYRRLCLETEDDAFGLDVSEALDELMEQFSALPLAAEYAKSRSHLLLRLRDGVALQHYCTCDGAACREKENQYVYGQRYKCVDCPDFDYCAVCFAAERTEHEGGCHRFLLIPHPVPRMTIYRVITGVKDLPHDVNPWKLEVTRSLVVPNNDEGVREDGGENTKQNREDVAVTEDITDTPQQPTVEIENLPLHVCRGPCNRSLLESGSPSYRCLSCEALNRNAVFGLCSDCAFGNITWDPLPHLATHILAPVFSDTAPAEVNEDHYDALISIQKVVDTITNEDLSKRMDKMEENIAALLSMVEKLQEVVLRIAESRA